MMISSTPVAQDTTSAAAITTNSSTSSTDPNNPNNLASEQTFLQLFVAQLQNQDPLDPNEQDPTQMVSELAQFSELEQLVNIGGDVQSIDNAVTSATGTTGSQPPSSTGTDNTGSTNSSQGT